MEISLLLLTAEELRIFLTPAFGVWFPISATIGLAWLVADVTLAA